MILSSGDYVCNYSTKVKMVIGWTNPNFRLNGLKKAWILQYPEEVKKNNIYMLHKEVSVILFCKEEV